MLQDRARLEQPNFLARLGRKRGMRIAILGGRFGGGFEEDRDRGSRLRRLAACR